MPTELEAIRELMALRDQIERELAELANSIRSLIARAERLASQSQGSDA